jgi:hypothetical protein
MERHRWLRPRCATVPEFRAKEDLRIVNLRVAPSSATNTANKLAGSVALAFSLTRRSPPGGS